MPYLAHRGRSIAMFVALSLLIPSLSWSQTAPTALQLFNRVRAGDAAALTALRRAAEAGNADSQFQLGRAYSFGGPNLPRDDAAAAQWVEKASQQGHAEAQTNLGYLYAAGLGVPKDGEKAIYWWTKAAEAGFGQAQFNLAIAFRQGNLVPKDEAREFSWMSRAAAQGIAAAQLSLGNMYIRGTGTPRNEREALNWFRKAAEQGNELAMSNLGHMYANGIGVSKDPAEALRWLKKPVASGNKVAREIYDRVCSENAKLCGSERAAAYFTFEMVDPKLRIIIPDAPPMQMGPHPLAAGSPHLRFMGAGPGAHTISVIVPTADAGMTPRDCARSRTSSLMRQFKLKAEEVVTRQTNEITTAVLFAVRIPSLIQLQAYLLSGYAGTHCVEIHLSKMVRDESEIAPWLKGFVSAKIERY